MGAVYPRATLKESLPTFSSLESWREKKSTKIDICARMCLHLLSRDDASPMRFEDGTINFPESPQPAPGEPPSYNNKILIYHEFPSFGPLIRSVCDLLFFGHCLFNVSRSSSFITSPTYISMVGQASMAVRRSLQNLLRIPRSAFSFSHPLVPSASTYPSPILLYFWYALG
jgi:hypothetical protein